MAKLSHSQFVNQIARPLGFQGSFGGGKFEDWLAKTGKQKEFNAKKKEVLSSLEEQVNNKPVPITQHMSETVQNPDLPTGTEFTPELQNVQQNELLEPVTIGDLQIDPPTPAELAQMDTTELDVDTTQITDIVDEQGATYDPTLTSAVTPMEAAQGQVSDLATVKGQLEQLLDFEGTNYPKWAQGAAAAAQEILAARGLGSSSIGAGAITAAIQKAALPIASQDASTYFQMDMQNLANEQQAKLTNIKFRQQNMLTDVAAENSAKQFNATSASQTQQFIANLVTQIDQNNKNRKVAVEQFNTQQANTMEQFNTQTELAVKKFNAELKNLRDQFNATNQFAVQQSNVLWRRSINTRNNEQVNAALATNVQQRFNLSSTALAALWQQFRDEQQFLFTAMENEKDRQMQMVHAANQRQFNSRNDESWVTEAGRLASKLLDFV